MKIINILQKLIKEGDPEKKKPGEPKPEKIDITAPASSTYVATPGEPQMALNMPDGKEGLSNSDLIVAATIYGEAGGEGYNGMKAVANVIKNRADNKNKNPLDIVLQKKQFSMWNNKPDDTSRMNYINSIEKKAAKNKSEETAWNNAKDLVDTHIKQKGDDNTKGAQFYHTTSIKPNWNWNKLEHTTTIGNHIFYKQIT